jgi:phospholipase D1/2
MNVERLPAERHGHRYARMQPDHGLDPEADPEGDAASSSRRPEVLAASASFRLSEATRVFEELPRATIFSVSRPDAGDITPMLLSYTIEINYKQVRGTPCPFPSSVYGSQHFLPFMDGIELSRKVVRIRC